MSRSNYFFLIIQLFITFSLTSADLFDAEWGLPTQNELYNYLSAVKNIVDFCAEFKDKIDNISLAFGLFVTNVNLGHALQHKWRTIPENVKYEIKNIIDENNAILRVYSFKQSMIQSNTSDDENSNKMSILTLMNSSYWVENMEKFVYTLEKQFTPDQIREMYSPFSLYLKKVDNFYKWFPNPVQSDSCLVSMSKNPTNMKSSAPRCSIDDLCYDMLKRGTNFGYSLTHRIIFLLMARFGRGCSVYTEHEDKELIKRFCSTAHAEASYIADNNYGLVDLFMEIIALCTIDGHSQFLKRTWLDNILKFRTPDGCYSALPVKKVKHIKGRSFFKQMGKYFNILQDGCSPHTTGLATSTFSAAVRFIIEKYY